MDPRRKPRRKPHSNAPRPDRKRNRDTFREVFVGLFNLRTIDDAFSIGGIAYRDVGGFVGERRSRVEGYYATIDFTSAKSVEPLLLVFEEVLFHLERPSSPEVATAYDDLMSRLERDGFAREKGRLTSPKMDVRTIDVRDLTSATEEAVHEHIAKANEHLAAGEYADAITHCYTLVEQLLKIVLRDRGVEFNQNQGDIRALYTLVSNELGLAPSDKTIDQPLKPILDGLQKLVAGIFEVSNKASNRHAKTYAPARRHAKLAVNSALALCDYVVESAANRPRSAG
ncbi:abortive infection family protein [Aureimonas sp. AU20]|uniref:abortive infection family protein n=1 Tax=Aureimonas sp. AU20 TaxID=1349819 RepID=UPI000721E3D0|nr:abortive infection family protein [Aureimonas sp. AU20]ALN73100.1 hypothetical protein M673_10227 [Aureimonas sp. AU20]